MITSTRRWLRRNRTRFAVGAGIVGVTYIAGQYVLSKFSEYRERAASDRAAKENLRRRFLQNQEDCNITVLALLTTATEGIVDALPVETLTHELQQKKAERLGRNVGSSVPATSIGSPSEGTSVAEEEGKSLTSESFVHASQMASSSATGEEEKKTQKTKAQLWNELKISSITRTLTLLYTLSLLNLFTRIQLNLLGRRTYISSLIASSNAPPSPTIFLENHDDSDESNNLGEKVYGVPDFETNRKYLTFSWWLLHRGWRDLMQEVEAAVMEVFGPMNPREDVSVERTSSLILEVRRRVEGRTVQERQQKRWLKYLMPPEDQETSLLAESGMVSPPPTAPSSSSSPSPPTNENPQSLPSPPSSPPASIPTTAISPLLRHLLSTSADLIESPPFQHILTLSLDATFSHLTDSILRTQAYKLPPLSVTPQIQSQPLSSSELFSPPSPPPPIIPAELTAGASTKLATILAVLTTQAYAIGKGGDTGGKGNEYMAVLGRVEEIDSFAGVIYAGMQDPDETGIDASEPSLFNPSPKDTLQQLAEETPTAAADAPPAEANNIAGGGGSGIFDEVSRQGQNMVGSAVGMFEGVWSRVIGEKGPGLE